MTEGFLFCSAELGGGGHHVLSTRAVPFPGDALPHAAHTWLPLGFNGSWAERSSLATNLKQPLPQLPPRLPPVALSDSS